MIVPGTDPVEDRINHPTVELAVKLVVPETVEVRYSVCAVVNALLPAGLLKVREAGDTVSPEVFVPLEL